LCWVGRKDGETRNFGCRQSRLTFAEAAFAKAAFFSTKTTDVSLKSKCHRNPSQTFMTMCQNRSKEHFQRRMLGRMWESEFVLLFVSLARN
jgi:hypothetical protein